MKIEYNPNLPPQACRFQCKECGTRFIAEEDEWFEEQEYRYLPPYFVAYCPVCGSRCTTNE